MHAFWELTPESPEHLNDMINVRRVSIGGKVLNRVPERARGDVFIHSFPVQFFKNVALAGSLIFYIGS